MRHAFALVLTALLNQEVPPLESGGFSITLDDKLVLRESFSLRRQDRGMVLQTTGRSDALKIAFTLKLDSDMRPVEAEGTIQFGADRPQNGTTVYRNGKAVTRETVNDPISKEPITSTVEHAVHSDGVLLLRADYGIVSPYSILVRRLQLDRGEPQALFAYVMGFGEVELFAVVKRVAIGDEGAFVITITESEQTPKTQIWIDDDRRILRLRSDDGGEIVEARRDKGQR